MNIQNTCACCGKSLTIKQPKFCSSSCSARVNNLNRGKLSSSHTAKISSTLKARLASGEITRIPFKKYAGPHSKVFFNTCFCGETFCSKTNKAKLCPGCRNTARIKNGIRCNMIEYKGIILDSSWELTIAKFLDENNIDWNRPKQPILYYINNKPKKYFPDFYLPTYNLYLDPKNPYRMQIDNEKIIQVSKTINLIVGNVNHIISQFKLILVSPSGIEPLS